MKPILGTAPTEYLPAIGLLLFTAAYLAYGYGYGEETRAFPVGVAWIMLGLLTLDLLSRSGTRLGRWLMRCLNPAADPATADQTRYPIRRQVSAIFWPAAFTALLLLIGILYAVPLYVFGAMRLRGQRSYLVSLIGGVGATLGIWLLFAVVLRLDLYPGLLFGGN